MDIFSEINQKIYDAQCRNFKIKRIFIPCGRRNELMELVARECFSCEKNGELLFFGYPLTFCTIDEIEVIVKPPWGAATRFNTDYFIEPKQETKQEIFDGKRIIVLDQEKKK